MATALVPQRQLRRVVGCWGSFGGDDHAVVELIITADVDR
jgi:hypothetical protein